MIKFKCVSCDKAYQLPDNAAGRKARCKACGEAMVVPDAPDELFDDSASAGDDLTALYGSSDSAGPIDHAVAADDPMAFSPDVGFQHEPRQHRSSGPPKIFILAGVGGALALIAIVVVIVIVMGGGGDDADDNADALAFDPGAISSSSTGASTSNLVASPRDKSSNSTQSGNDPTRFNTDDSYVPYFDGELLDKPAARSLRQWFFKAPEDVRSELNRVVHRGIAFYVPNDWAVETKLILHILPDTEIRDFYSHLYEGRPERNSMVTVQSPEDDDIAMIVSQRPTDRDWPWIYRVSRGSSEMLFGRAVLEKFEKGVPSYTGSSSAAESGKAFVERLRKKKLHHPILFELFDPQRFYFNFMHTSSIGHGTLLGGHRFVRIQFSSQKEDGERRTGVMYIGFVGDLQVVLSAETRFNDFDRLNDLEWILRTSELLEKAEAREASLDDEAYRAWLEDDNFGLVFAGDKAPETDLKITNWYPSAKDSLFISAGSSVGEEPPVTVALEETDPDTSVTLDDGPSIIGPHSSSYTIMLPEGLDLISQTRVAVRTSPHADGTWLSMEVHKLAGLDRREPSPVSADRSTVLLRGRRIAIPTGVEVSDLATDHFTAKRLLYPRKPGSDTRRVEYVIKDGPYLISVLGRFPANDDARLAMLDEAAKSVQPIEGD
ncbi:MAG: hypothetical protein KTR15_09320 [Phycisphaeraceae bacterium]|nr:hypothetical protein [Phycisphaeraceae bacterium]